MPTFINLKNPLIERQGFGYFFSEDNQLFEYVFPGQLKPAKAPSRFLFSHSKSNQPEQWIVDTMLNLRILLSFQTDKPLFLESNQDAIRHASIWWILTLYETPVTDKAMSSLKQAKRWWYSCAQELIAIDWNNPDFDPVFPLNLVDMPVQN
jgi:hypothetical protein